MLTLLCAVVSMAWGETETVFYTLTPTTGTNNGYANNCDIAINGITWNVTGNATFTPWRIGGKSLENVDRTVYSKTAMGSEIDKVELSVGNASSITVNSLKLVVASDAAFSNLLDEVSATFSANSTITFEPTSGEKWDNNSYYKFVFNVSVSSTSNKFVEFSEAKFYKPSGSQQLTSEKYELFNGTPTTIVEGDYIITGNYGDSKYAMSNDDSNNSFKGKTDFQMDGNANIVTDDKTIVWHIAPNGDNWTIQSLDDKQYAAYIGSSDGVTMTSTLDDKAFWSYNGNNGFTNKAYNANLYFNNGYFSFAQIGTPVFTLYRKHVAVEKPVISPNGGTFTDTQSVEITCGTPGVSIYYTTDGNYPSSSSTLYTKPFDIAANTTVKAIAIIADDESEIAEETFTKIPLWSIAEVRTKGIGTTVYTQGIVTSIYDQTAYIQDVTAAICVYGNENLKVGQEIKVKGDLVEYHGLLEITSPIWSVVSEDNEVQPTNMTIADVNTNTKQGWLVKIENATVQSIGSNGKDVTISQGENTILVRFNDTNDVKFFKDDVITLTGNIGFYDNVQIANPKNIEIQIPAVLLYEGFSKYESDGDGTQAININNSNLDYKRWKSFTKVYLGGKDNAAENGGCGKLGSGQGIGSMEVDNIAMTGSGVLIFKVKQYGNNENCSIKVTIDGATATYNDIVSKTHEIDLETDWVEHVINLTDAQGAVSITFATTSKQAYIDEIRLAKVFNFSISDKASDGTDCYATISALGDGNWIVKGDVVVSTVVVENKVLTYPKQFVEGDVIPGDGAYLVKGAAGNYAFIATDEEATKTIGESDNMLLSTGEGNIQTNAPTGETDNNKYYFYKLSLNANSKAGSVGFYWGAPEGKPFTYGKAKQAYLAVPKTDAFTVQGFSFDGTTGIAEVESAVNGNVEVYTISGLRVDGSNLSKGVYIVNGKKVIIK